MEIDDLPNVLDAAGVLVHKQGEHWPHLTSTVDRLAADPAHVLALTVDLVSDLDSAPQNNLPVPDFDETGFFGRRAQIERIKKAIKGAYPVISILGDGGLGKTSLALKVAYELLDEPAQKFDAFVWVTAKATVLTVNEIRRISDAVQDSLGLFAMAARELGAESSSDPTEELLNYLENFKILLFLDNMETVLDQRLREFLLELPLGSKVVITSRIGLGIENPVQLAPLSEDEAANLLRALARIRQVALLSKLPQTQVLSLAKAMGGHPAYIKWFVSGVQAGKRPEELLSNNELLLEFCMSNVFEYLDDPAKAVLRSMQALPGPKTQAELAFLNDCNAKEVQGALLSLISTNFVQMQSLSPTQLLETTYELSDFGKQYLNKAQPVSADEQAWLLGRHHQLNELGDDLKAENSASPFDPYTVDIRGFGDFHVAKLLRDAMLAVQSGDSDGAIFLCKEAQGLSPTYHEPWRVEALIQELRADFTSAGIAYERAAELAPESAPLNYFYGTFLAAHGGNPRQGLRRLQRAANVTNPDLAVLAEIARTHMTLGDWSSAVATASHAIQVGRLQPREATNILVVGLRAAFVGASGFIDSGAHALGLELVEESLPLCEAVSTEYRASPAFDRMLQIEVLCRNLSASTAEDFLARKSASFAKRLADYLSFRDLIDGARRIGTIKTLVHDKFYGFIRSDSKDYFFHGRDLSSRDDWTTLSEGMIVAFRPIDQHLKGPRAGEPAILD